MNRTFAATAAVLILLVPLASSLATGKEAMEVPASGPDLMVGDIAGLTQSGSSGTQVGLAVGITACNNGGAELDFFHLPNPNHPVVAQNLYRMSGGPTNDERFEQVGQSWLKHMFFARNST